MSITSPNLQHAEKVARDSKQPVVKWRYVIAFMGFLMNIIISFHRTVMSVAIVAMVNNTAISNLSAAKSDSCPNLLNNTTKNENTYEEGEFAWSPRVQGYVLGSYFVGQLSVQLPSGLLAERYGCKRLLFATIFLTSLFTLLIPPISWLSISALIAIQAMRGLVQGPFQSSTAILTSNWFPIMERGFLYGFIWSAASLGTFFGSIFTGFICDSSGGWPYAFYTYGSVGLIVALSIPFLLAENPRVHPHISKTERDFILSNQECVLHQKRPKKPWKRMLTSIPVYAFAVGFFGHNWAVAQFWTVQSIFLGTILHFPISKNGIFTALPFLVQFLCNQLGTWLSFYMQNVARVNFIRKFWTYVSALGISGSLLGMYFVGCSRFYSILFSILLMGFVGLGTPAIGVVATDMTPTFAGSLHAIMCTIGFTPYFIIPVIVGYLTNGMQTIEQWNKVFFISIGVVMFCKTVFILFGSAEVQPWNFVEEKTPDKAEKQKEDVSKNDKDDKYQQTTPI